jgi:hypothetical protein
MSRLTQADRISGGAAFVLFISLFLPWFSISAGSGVYSLSLSWSGLSAHGYLYIPLILSIGLVLYLVARAGLPQQLKLPIPHEMLVLAVSAVNLLLVLIGFLAKPGGYGISGVGWDFGAFIGLLAALAALAPTVMPMIQARMKAK